MASTSSYRRFNPRYNPPSKQHGAQPHPHWVAALAAEPVYRLFARQGLGTTNLPAAGKPILHDMGFLTHEGGHGMIPSDWDVFLQFLNLHPRRPRCARAGSVGPLHYHPCVTFGFDAPIHRS
ncbi:MAG TPA: hypothetical protein VNH18_18420 [Bryobacteraceae bacterium]|nr:hypothetical protein [Bryobacteraceae bacterium]